MKLLLDVGNSRLKWQLRRQGSVVARGLGELAGADPLTDFPPAAPVKAIAISAVTADEVLAPLLRHLERRFSVEPRCYWAEAGRGGLRNAYEDLRRMGADRWHGMYGAWLRHRSGFVVVDAGSAVTLDYVDAGGQHLGGFILPGQGMMLRSLRRDVARVVFKPGEVLDDTPGKSTSECVNHGLAWLLAGLVERIQRDAESLGLTDVIVTGGDAPRWLALGLRARHCADLVFDGLAAIDAEEQGA